MFHTPQAERVSIIFDAWNVVLGTWEPGILCTLSARGSTSTGTGTTGSITMQELCLPLLYRYKKELILIQ
jgi:hypothetical protein